MRTSETLSKIAPALVKAINAMDGVKKDAKGNFGKHATLEGVIEASHGPLSENGLTVLQGPGPLDGNAITLTTRLLHESGEWIETDFSLPMGKVDPQGAGSAVSYARRYSLMAMLNIAAVDDDGEAAMSRNQPQAAPKAQAPAKPLSARADALEKALREAPAGDLDKSWALGSSLMALLETDDPERFKKLEDLYTELRVGS